MAEAVQTTTATTHIIRPRAVKATATFAATVTVAERGQFDNECRQAGFSEFATEHAVSQAAEWHRRWVLQEEEGHTMPFDTDQWVVAIDAMRRAAQNPSLSDGSSSSCSPQICVPQGLAIIRPIALRPRNVTELSLGTTPPSVFASEMESPSSPLTLPSDDYSPVALDLDDMPFECFAGSIPSVIRPKQISALEQAKDVLLHALAISGGDVETKAFSDALIPLVRHYAETGWDACDPEGIYLNKAGVRSIEGLWLTLTKASYFGCLGETPDGDPMYTLGRMSFDMFLPTQLVCSLQGNFNPVKVVTPEERMDLMERCPKSLQEEIGSGNTILRKYE